MKKLIYLLWSVAIIVADQLSKYHMVNLISENGSIEVIKGVLGFSYVKNYGAAWGMLQNARIFFIVITVLVLVLGAFFLIKKKTACLEKTALFMIGSGAVGNLIDRIQLGYVRDFIEVKFISFPIFNLADMFIVTGAGLFILHTLFFEEKDKSGKNKSHS